MVKKKNLFVSWFHLATFRLFSLPEQNDVQENDQSAVFMSEFNKNFKGSHFTVTLLKTCKKEMLVAGSINFLFTLSGNYFMPVLFSLLLDSLNDSVKSLLLVFAIFGLEEFRNYLSSCYSRKISCVLQRTSTIWRNSIHAKTLRLSSVGRNDYGSGEILNLMDTGLRCMVNSLMSYCSVPLMCIISPYLLFNTLGYAAFTGLIILLHIPINYFIFKKYRENHGKHVKCTDELTQLHSESLNNIKIVKMYGWEKSFQERIMKVREEQLRLQKQNDWLLELSGAMEQLFQFIALALSFKIYMNLDPEKNLLTSQVIAYSITGFDYFNYAVSSFGPMHNTYKLFKKDAEKVEKFLGAEEVEGKAMKCSDSGEMKTRSGSVEINGSISYVPQQAWIQNMTLKDNVLFGKPYNQKEYLEILRNCALVEDLKSLPDGDQTMIGAKGTNLSGGQKQRVSLARAIYQDKDIVLLDDPLSAVDAHVGKHIFENVISSKTGCLRDKTRVLVTHNLVYLKNCDKIVVMEDGKIKSYGTFEEITENDSELLKKFDLEEMGMEEISMEELDCEFPDDDQELEAANVVEEPIADMPAKPKESDKLSAYSHYFQAVGIRTLLVYTCVSAIGIYLGVHGSFHLAGFSDQATNEEAKAGLWLYAMYGICEVLLAFYGTMLIINGTTHASRKLFQNLLLNILKSPMEFFDVTPIGLILSRLGSDKSDVDKSFPSQIRKSTTAFITCLASIIGVLWVTPSALGHLLVILFIYGFVLSQYLPRSRQLNEAYHDSRSPTLSFIQESLHGAASIRAYGATERFERHCQQLSDNSRKAYYAGSNATRWFNLRTKLLGNLVVLVASLFAVYHGDVVTAGILVFSITTARKITGNFNNSIQSFFALDSCISSVERMRDFAVSSTERIGTRSVPRSWPQQGEIIIKNLSLRYRSELDLVLRGISLTINPGKKIGIVGRTGAGKSSLTLALFRMIEAEEGSIEIDGVDISELDLAQLRSRLTIVPQDPVCFSGSLRMNLDPLSEYSNLEIWVALGNAHLAETVKELPGMLDYQITENGGNLSVGQRQLLCLARALLRKSKILVLDESAASIDMETDKLVQKTIREQCGACTVLTIAHRLNTVMDSDRIMVLDKGVVVEFDTPKNLLSEQNGMFYSMARDANII
ncbi:hypothetical protein CAEBREN_19130 [Caenorhabditis brenneri]|uniref:Uncharacterized protein n=1 Tax=Caenorhabditis brenneri TaxID=135651 RepID=G0NPA1_CAEBE|nr:hypothetical protein CAEBREN_19130 [Caenorhabditis brenneri]